MTRDPDAPDPDESTALATAQLYREIAFIRALLDDKVDARHREMLDASELVKEKLQAISQRIDMMESARLEYKADTKDRVEAALAAQQRAIAAALDAVTTANSIQTESLKTEFHEHLVQYRRETDMAFDAAHKATGAALASSEKAISKAEAANEKRFESVNEFRQTLSDQAALFISRTEALSLAERNAERIQDLTDRMNTQQGHSEGVKVSTGMIFSVIGAIAAVVIIVNIVILLVAG